MQRIYSRSLLWVGNAQTALGSLLLFIGILVGWVTPKASQYLTMLSSWQMQTSLVMSRGDLEAFLGADLTALTIIIAVFISYNAATIQIAGQLLSPALVRTILVSLIPFLICWSFVAMTILVYFIIPPLFILQIWQILIWFLAILFLMTGYIWNLPWRLSGENAARTAISLLRNIPISAWQQTEGYSVLQTGIAAATARDDLSTVRAMSLEIGKFLASKRDAIAERPSGYDSERFRVLKNLLTGCAQHADTAPRSVVYNLGFVTAGTIVLSAATGNIVDDKGSDIFTVLLRALHGETDLFDPLWTGTCHALCGRKIPGDAYLIMYWKNHASWTMTEPRLTQDIAVALGRFLEGFKKELTDDERYPVISGMLKDIYRDIAEDLRDEIINNSTQQGRLLPLSVQLLAEIHQFALQNWPETFAEAERHEVIQSYGHYLTLLKGEGGTAH